MDDFLAVFGLFQKQLKLLDFMPMKCQMAKKALVTEAKRAHGSPEEISMVFQDQNWHAIWKQQKPKGQEYIGFALLNILVVPEKCLQ